MSPGLRIPIMRLCPSQKKFSLFVHWSIQETSSIPLLLQGYLYYTNEKQCHTLHSRFSGLWASAVSAASSTRPPSCLRRACIFFCASVVSLFLILLMPPICLLFSTLSIALALIVLPSIPILSLGFHIFCVTLWDFYRPGELFFSKSLFADLSSL